MSRNILREIRNQVRAESRMKTQMDKTREKALAQVEKNITVLYADGQETVDFRFDGFQLWGMNAPEFPEDILAVFSKMLPESERWFWGNGKGFFLDNWNRGVLTLPKDLAVEMAIAVESWNADWEVPIARGFGVDPSDYYNSYKIGFGPASGAERVISVSSPNGHKNDSWQWS